jgi:hypothetical protein
MRSFTSRSRVATRQIANRRHCLTSFSPAGPDVLAVYRNGGHPARIEQHCVTASRRELIFRKQLPNPHEQQAAFFRADEPHPAKADSGVAARIVGEDDLVGRQRHSKAVWKQHEDAWRAVPDNRKRGRPVLLPEERGRSHERDEQRCVFHMRFGRARAIVRARRVYVAWRVSWKRAAAMWRLERRAGCGALGMIDASL